MTPLDFPSGVVIPAHAGVGLGLALLLAACGSDPRARGGRPFEADFSLKPVR